VVDISCSLRTLRKMGLILRSIERRPRMQFPMARKIMLQPLRQIPSLTLLTNARYTHMCENSEILNVYQVSPIALSYASFFQIQRKHGLNIA
jgi:hypothetical protein